MHCKSCNKSIYVNYGSMEEILCKDCHAAKYGDPNKTEKVNYDAIRGLGKAIVFLGSLYLIAQIIAFFIAIIENDGISIVILKSAIGLIIISVGYLMPCLISIERGIRELIEK